MEENIPTREELLEAIETTKKILQSDTYGQSDFESMRIGGMKIEDLPMAEQAEARSQLPFYYKTENEHKIGLIKRDAPTQSVAYLKARVNEANDNIRRVNELIGRENALISEYSGVIVICEFRDKEIAAIKDDPDKEEKLKVLKDKFGVENFYYNVEKMKTQVEQSQESIDRANTVIAQEHASINELNGLIKLCEKRDNDLKNLGEKIKGE